MLPPLSELTAALHLGHFTITEASSFGLSQTLQRQIRHVSYEFMQLKDEEFGPNSNQTYDREWVQATEHLMRFYGEARERGMEEPKLMEAAELEETTLREIRTLRGTDHFFAETLDGFFRGLTMLGVDYEQFASALVWELHKYRIERDIEEARFLKPFHVYRDEMLAVIKQVAGGHPFKHFEVENRIKRDLLGKLQKRGWKTMNDEFYDVVGFRIIVGSPRGVDAAVALLEGAFKVHESAALLDPSVPHYFRIDHIEHKVSVDAIVPGTHVDVKEGYLRVEYNDRGYEAVHVNVRRHCSDNGHNHPTAEIQVKRRGQEEWGEIQRLLADKDWPHRDRSLESEPAVSRIERVPDEIKTAIKAYCRSASAYIAACEEGNVPSMVPEFDIMSLNRIEEDSLRSERFDRICDMDAKMKEYRDGVKQSIEQTSENTAAHH